MRMVGTLAKGRQMLAGLRVELIDLRSILNIQKEGSEKAAYIINALCGH